MIVVPLIFKENVVGVLKVTSAEVDFFKAEDVATLEMIAGVLSSTINDAVITTTLQTTNTLLNEQKKQLETINEKLEIMATSDGLTGLKNSRFFHEQLASEFQRARRYKQPLSMILLDVDHFKKFNDTFGHLAGDGALRDVANVIKQTSRTIDIAARYGGEEFAVILPQTDTNGAKIIAQRICDAIAAMPQEHRTITASIGVSSLDENKPDATAMTAAADKALYLSKERGRNCVTLETDLGTA